MEASRSDTTLLGHGIDTITLEAALKADPRPSFIVDAKLPATIDRLTLAYAMYDSKNTSG